MGEHGDLRDLMTNLIDMALEELEPMNGFFFSETFKKPRRMRNDMRALVKRRIEDRYTNDPTQMLAGLVNSYDFHELMQAAQCPRIGGADAGIILNN